MPATRPIDRSIYIERIAAALDDLGHEGVEFDGLAKAEKERLDRLPVDGRNPIVLAAELMGWPMSARWELLGHGCFCRGFLTDTPESDHLLIEALDDDTLVRVADLLDGALRHLGIVHATAPCC